jgi:hypothetical protein
MSLWTKDRPTKPGYYWLRTPVFEENERPEYVAGVAPLESVVLVLERAGHAADLYVLGWPCAREELIPIGNIIAACEWQPVEAPK